MIYMESNMSQIGIHWNFTGQKRREEKMYTGIIDQQEATILYSATETQIFNISNLAPI